MKILSFWGSESNPFANPNLAANGGGYSQPEGGAVIKLANGKLAVVNYFDHDCGDFGRDAHVSVEVGGRIWSFEFGSSSANDYDAVAPSFFANVGEELSSVAGLAIDAVLTAMMAK